MITVAIFACSVQRDAANVVIQLCVMIVIPTMSCFPLTAYPVHPINTILPLIKNVTSVLLTASLAISTTVSPVMNYLNSSLLTTLSGVLIFAEMAMLLIIHVTYILVPLKPDAVIHAKFKQVSAVLLLRSPIQR